MIIIIKIYLRGNQRLNNKKRKYNIIIINILIIMKLGKLILLLFK